jgi:hypothetical protein
MELHMSTLTVVLVSAWHAFALLLGSIAESNLFMPPVAQDSQVAGSAFSLVE